VQATDDLRAYRDQYHGCHRRDRPSRVQPAGPSHPLRSLRYSPDIQTDLGLSRTAAGLLTIAASPLLQRAGGKPRPHSVGGSATIGRSCSRWSSWPWPARCDCCRLRLALRRHSGPRCCHRSRQRSDPDPGEAASGRRVHTPRRRDNRALHRSTNRRCSCRVGQSAHHWLILAPAGAVRCWSGLRPPLLAAIAWSVLVRRPSRQSVVPVEGNGQQNVQPGTRDGRTRVRR